MPRSLLSHGTLGRGRPRLLGCHPGVPSNRSVLRLGRWTIEVTPCARYHRHQLSDLRQKDVAGPPGGSRGRDDDRLWLGSDDSGDRRSYSLQRSPPEDQHGGLCTALPHEMDGPVPVGTWANIAGAISCRRQLLPEPVPLMVQHTTLLLHSTRARECFRRGGGPFMCLQEHDVQEHDVQEHDANHEVTPNV